jgi:acyl-CoA synthetase (AMP-forming)/AMP-acid ligase II
MPAHHKFWPNRLPYSITVPATSVWENLAINARRYPDKAALVFLGAPRPISSCARDGAHGRLSAWPGREKGDRVIVLMQNSSQLVLAHYAIFRANAVVVPVNPMNTAEELKHYITDSGAKVAITTADLAPELAKASNACHSPKRCSTCWSPGSPTVLMPMCRGRMHRPKPGATGCSASASPPAEPRPGPCLDEALACQR